MILLADRPIPVRKAGRTADEDRPSARSTAVGGRAAAARMGKVLRSRSFQIRLTARPPVHSREKNGSPCCARAVLAIACRARIECDLETAVRESGVSMRAFRRWSISSHDDGPRARARLRPQSADRQTDTRNVAKARSNSARPRLSGPRSQNVGFVGAYGIAERRRCSRGTGPPSSPVPLSRRTTPPTFSPFGDSELRFA